MDISKRLQFKTDENGFISEFMNVGSEGILPDGISLEIDIDNFDFDDFLMNYQAYKFDGNKIERDDEQAVIVQDENEKELLRVRRLKARARMNPLTPRRRSVKISCFTQNGKISLFQK